MPIHGKSINVVAIPVLDGLRKCRRLPFILILKSTFEQIAIADAKTTGIIFSLVNKSMETAIAVICAGSRNKTIFFIPGLYLGLK